MGETLEMLQTCYQQLGKSDEWEVFCAAAWRENAGATAELMLAQIARAAGRRRSGAKLRDPAAGTPSHHARLP